MDTYILKQTPLLIDNIYYLKNNDQTMIIDDFLYKMLNVSDNEKDTINFNDVLKNTISIKYPNIYLSDDNLKDISELNRKWNLEYRQE